MSFSSSPQARTTLAGQSASSDLGDAIGPDAGFLAHICEIATQEGRIGSHPEHALRIVACRAAGSTCSTADTSCWSGI
jgi:hypothetical protein